MATQKKTAEAFLEGLFGVRVYPMMGDYVVYCKEKTVGCICDDTLFVKITPSSKRLLEGAPQVPPYVGAKPRFVVQNGDKAFIQELLSAVADDIAPKKRK